MGTLFSATLPNRHISAKQFSQYNAISKGPQGLFWMLLWEREISDKLHSISPQNLSDGLRHFQFRETENPEYLEATPPNTLLTPTTIWAKHAPNWPEMFCCVLKALCVLLATQVMGIQFKKDASMLNNLPAHRSDFIMMLLAVFQGQTEKVKEWGVWGEKARGREQLLSPGVCSFSWKQKEWNEIPFSYFIFLKLLCFFCSSSWEIQK